MIDASPGALDALYDESLAAAGRARQAETVEAQRAHNVRVASAATAVLRLSAERDAALAAVTDGAPASLATEAEARVAAAQAELKALDAGRLTHAIRATDSRNDAERARHAAAQRIADFAADALLNAVTRIAEADAAKQAAIRDYEVGLRAIAYATSRGWRQRPDVKGGLRMMPRAPRPHEMEIPQYPSPEMMKATLVEMGAWARAEKDEKQ